MPRKACGAVHEGCLFQCNVCVKHSRRWEYLGEHLVLFMKELGFRCDVCGKDCTGGDYLKEHMRTVHEGSVTHCTICNIIYSLYTWD